MGNRKLLLLALLASVASTGCGNYELFNLGTVTAARGADGRVTVTAPLTCTTLGESGCSYNECVAVEWANSFDTVQPEWPPSQLKDAAVDVGEGGALFDRAQTCRSVNVASNQTDTFTVVSTAAIPSGLQLTVFSDWIYSQGRYQYRDYQTIASP